MDPDTRRLVMFAGGLGVVLIALISASAIVGRHSGEVPVVIADSRPIREKPVNPGGMKIDGAENDVFSGGSDTSDARLAPAPESPNAKALHVGAAPPPAHAAGAVEAPAPVTFEPPSAPAGDANPAVAAVAPPAAKPVPAKAPAGIAQPAVKSVPAKPPVAASETHAATPGHQPMVQLAALTSEDAARAEWAQLTKKMPDLLNGRQPSYSRTERDGHTFWRVRTMGFTDVAQARSFCDRVRTKGAGCSVADF
jgi:hypothetical protein